MTDLMPKVLCIGYGSIGKKHLDILKTKKCEVALVSSQKNTPFAVFTHISEALTKFNPDVIFICNSTSAHKNSLEELEYYKGPIYIEKPIFANSIFKDPINKSNIFTLYNLRHHKLILSLKKILHNEEIISANVYCGQYLPLWRPERDYSKTYSASIDQGGGVLRDLSHELDYCNLLFGNFITLGALGGKFSSLNIETEDSYNIIGNCEFCPNLNLSLNYLDKTARRTILVHTNSNSYFLDFIKGTLSKNGDIIDEGFLTSETYVCQIDAILSNSNHNFCNFTQAIYIVNLIEKIEESNRLQRFITL